MEDSIIIFIAIALVFGSFLRDSYKRRNRRANPTRHRRQRRWGGPYSAGETGGATTSVTRAAIGAAATGAAAEAVVMEAAATVAAGAATEKGAAAP